MTYVTVEVDLSEFDDKALIEEIKSRGFAIVSESEVYEIVERIYNLRNNSKKFDQELDKLIYTVIGRIQ